MNRSPACELSKEGLWKLDKHVENTQQKVITVFYRSFGSCKLTINIRNIIKCSGFTMALASERSQIHQCTPKECRKA